MSSPAGLMVALSAAARAAIRAGRPGDGVTVHVALLTGARFAAACMTAVTAVVLARSLTKSDYGQLALLTGIVGFIVVMADAGLTSSLARYLSQQQVDRRLFLRAVALRGALVGVAALGILAYGAVGGAPGFGSATVLASILLLANSAVSLAHGILPTLRRIGAAALITVVQPAVELSGILIAVRVGLTAPAALGAMTVAAASGAVIGSIVLLAQPMSVGDPVAMPEIVRYALPLFGVFACVSVFGVVDQVLIALFHDAATLAPYALSWKLIVFLHVPAVAVASVVAPRLSPVPERTPELFGHWLQRTAIASAGVLAVTAALAPEIFALIDAQYRPDAPVLQALSGFAVLLSLAPLVSMACNFLGGARARLKLAVVAVVVNILLDLALIPAWGPYGAAISSTIAYLIYVLGHARVAARLLNERAWPGGARVALRIVAGVAVAVGVARFAVHGLPAMAPMIGTGISALVALAVYVAVVGVGALR